MLTPDEVRAVPLFASLSDADLDRLVRTSADVRLNPGEYAVHEGGERALYAVLSGKFEVVKRFDGVERTLGWRLPGTFSCHCSCHCLCSSARRQAISPHAWRQPLLGDLMRTRCARRPARSRHCAAS